MDENRYLEQLWQSLLNSIVILLHGYVIFAVFFHPLYYQSDIRFVYHVFIHFNLKCWVCLDELVCVIITHLKRQGQRNQESILLEKPS
mmetsp:Transcript_15239/g.31864  ORF Transcript_15239/g.31864 Transcript_15239/m.31864 type:complete len:88 (-) Transcript_15239:2-265(-)